MEAQQYASSLTLAALAVLAGASVAVRSWLDRARSAERIGLLLHHVVALTIAAGAPLVTALGADSRPLMLCGVGPLLVLCLHGAVPPRAALGSVPVVLFGLAAQALVFVHWVPGAIAGSTSAAFAGASCAAAAWLVRRRALSSVVPRQRALLHSQVLALCVAAFGCSLAALPSFTLGSWAAMLGAAGAVGTAARLAPNAPPRGADVVFAATLLPIAAVVARALTAPPVLAVHTGLWVASAALGASVLVRAAWPLRSEHPASAHAVRTARVDGGLAQDPERTGDRLGDAEDAGSVRAPASVALSAMGPLVSDVQHAPPRPRVITRAPAKRLLDAALERARTSFATHAALSSAPPPQGTPKRREAGRVEVNFSDTDLDVEAELSELSEALSAVLDRAFGLRADRPDVVVQVNVRGGPNTVTFEISDQVHNGGPLAPFGNLDAPFSAGVDTQAVVAVARARHLVERNGGKLLTRENDEGATVHITVPRRLQRSAHGQA